MPDSYNKVKIYDEEIAPLMKQVNEICLKHNIQMATQFYLKDADFRNCIKALYVTNIIDNMREKQIHRVTKAMLGHYV